MPSLLPIYEISYIIIVTPLLVIFKLLSYTIFLIIYAFVKLSGSTIFERLMYLQKPNKLINILLTKECCGYTDVTENILNNPNISLKDLSYYNYKSSKGKIFNKDIFNEIIISIQLYFKPIYIHISEDRDEYAFEMNPNIRMIDVNIIDNPNINLDFNMLSKNPSITMEFIEANYHLNWNPIYIADNPNITEEFIYKYFTREKINNFCINEGINETEWDSIYNQIFGDLATNDNISYDLLEKLYKSGNISIYDILIHPNYTLNLIKQTIHIYTELQKDEESIYRWLSKNQNITIDFILDNLEKKWNWGSLTINKGIKVSDILNNRHLPWENSWYLNPNIMPYDLIKYKKMKITDWVSVSSNVNVSMEYIFNNLDLPWDWNYVSFNPNLTPDIIAYNPQINWNYENIGNNLMTYNPEYYKKNIKHIIKKSNLIISDLSTILNDYV